ncbi:alpha/beta fold hydrolase [Seongchinamella sediminis]|uniref:Alpha/beta fold hydrolase n=1 Tax=Seongchinamella sediminis TaxID=2283635 RepID=A0A3L7E2L1_9GAMM|nr:alpha/beta hydrolase [Seongchinamella sediminis]RLQ22452.1 alpha/beta fold hydrolase [Seongchinamella sediminis]
MRIEDWQARGTTRSLLGHEIFFIDEPATGEHRGTVLLIHGFPSASWDWWKIWPALNRHYRLVAMDMLGFGFSAKPRPHDYRIMEQADICEALVRELALESFHVLAHDYGDTVAQELLARQTEGAGAGQCLSCLFLNGGLFPETHQALLVQRLLQGPLGFLVRHAFSRRSMRRSFDRIFGPETRASDEEMEALWQLFTRDNGQRNLHRLIQYMADRRRHRERWLQALQQACCPIGLVNGSVDPVSGEHMVQRFVKLVGGDYFIRRLPAIGHYPQLEAPDAVSAAYLEFLQQL